MTTERIIAGIYKITEKLGEGGMGEVFKGFDTLLEREVAIKSLRPELCSRPDVVERFHNEAVALGRMNHSNIATVYSFLNDSGQWFLVLEFVRGETLDALLVRRGALPWREAVKIVCQALDGLEHAHRLGIVHRDIKPANMILTPAGGLKLMDFGIARLLERARLTHAGHLIGTIEYMSPEQVEGKDTDARGDIYSMGIVLYELLTGRVPFQKDSDYSLIRAQVEEQPTPPTALLPSVPKDLEKVVLMALQKKPTQRYASASAFQADLQGLLSSALDNIERPRTAAPETRFDIGGTGFAIDAPQLGSQTHHTMEGAKQPAIFVNAPRDAMGAITSQADEQSHDNLPGTWQRYRLWIVAACVLSVTMGVIASLLLLRHDAPAPIASATSAPKSRISPQSANKTEVNAKPDTLRTAEPARRIVVQPASTTEQVLVPEKAEPTADNVSDSESGQAAKKVVTGASGVKKTRKKVEKAPASSQNTRKIVKPRKPQAADDWEVLGHQ